jgi:phosphohistidine phosphatase
MSPRTAAERRLETVHLVRHAHAGDAELWDGPDELRPLTRKGRRQAERLGAFLVRVGIRPDRIISSPKVRALQTAEAIGLALGIDVDIDERLSSGCYMGCLDVVLGDSGARAPMVVGHDPDFSILLSGLLGAAPQEMRKGAFATIDVRRPLRAGTGVLRWLIPPELLADADGGPEHPAPTEG